MVSKGHQHSSHPGTHDGRLSSSSDRIAVTEMESPSPLKRSAGRTGALLLVHAATSYAAVTRHAANFLVIREASS